jgi:hypothetical protein
MGSDSVATVIQTLTLPDDEFFALDDAATTALQARVAKAVQAARPLDAQEPLPELRAVSAPTQVDWNRRQAFPVLVAEVRSNQREWEVQALQNRALTVSNLDTGAVDIIAPLDKGRRMPVLTPSRSGEPPDAFNAALSSIGVRRYNLLDWFPRNLLEGRVAITFLDYDLVSNTALVDAGRNATPGASASLRDTTRVRALSAATTAGPAGVTVRAPALMTAAPAILEGAVRLSRGRVTTLDAPPDASHPLLLAASLLLVQIDRVQPVTVHLAVPARADSSGNVEAAFTLDLHRLLAGHVTTGDWLVYLVVGDTLSGPHAMTVESP